MPLCTGEEIFSGEAGGGTLSRRNRRPEEFPHDNNARSARLCLNNGMYKLPNSLILLVLMTMIWITIIVPFDYLIKDCTVIYITVIIYLVASHTTDVSALQNNHIISHHFS